MTGGLAVTVVSYYSSTATLVLEGCLSSCMDPAKMYLCVQQMLLGVLGQALQFIATYVHEQSSRRIRSALSLIAYRAAVCTSVRSTPQHAIRCPPYYLPATCGSRRSTISLHFIPVLSMQVLSMQLKRRNSLKFFFVYDYHPSLRLPPLAPYGTNQISTAIDRPTF